MFAVAIAVMGATMAIAPTSRGATATSCRVWNVTADTHDYSLARAIRRAHPDDTLRIKGVCRGNFYVDIDLTLRGVSTPSSGPATLDGNHIFTVLTITVGAHVRVVGLVITHGFGEGAGIYSEGHAVVRSSIIRDNSTPIDEVGGGVWNRGFMTIEGSLISDNDAGFGGGIENYLGLSIKDSVIRNNTAFGGGGIDDEGAFVVLNDTRIYGNTATIRGAAGLTTYSEVTLAGATVITGNSALTLAGGIVAYDGGAAVPGARGSVVAADGSARHRDPFTGSILPSWTGRVDNNTPTNCYSDPVGLITITCG